MQNSKLENQNDKVKFKKEFNQRLIYFSLEIIKLCKEIRENKNISTISDQLIRSSTSIGANIIEARESSSKRDYIRFFEYALKSANETVYWLVLIQQSTPSLKKHTSENLNEANEIAKIIASSLLTLKGKR
jgi:four helix bundle protein